MIGNDEYKNRIRNIFNYNHGYSADTFTIRNALITNNTGFNCALKVNIKKSYIDIPLVAYHKIYSMLRDNYSSIDSISINMVVDSLYTERYKTVDPAIKYCYNILPSERLKPFKIKDTLYYFGRGIILDEEFNPILIMCYRLNNEILDTEAVYFEDRIYDEVKGIVKIDNDVFTSKDLVSKHIMTKLIPTLLDMTFYESVQLTRSLTTKDYRLTGVSFEFADLNKECIKRAKFIPQCSTAFDDYHINEWLYANDIEAILFS